MATKIYTIGHSTHEIDYFIELVKHFNINCLVDVRSVAASSLNPQFNKEVLYNLLKKHKITYLHFAKEFGARHTDFNLLDDEGKVDFDKVRDSISFKNGIERVQKGVEKGFIIALMCSESDPLDCHRFSMISVALDKKGFEVNHILKDKTFKSNAELEEQLLKRYERKVPKPTLFEPNINLEDQLRAAYRLKNKEIAYSPYSRLPQENDD